MSHPWRQRAGCVLIAAGAALGSAQEPAEEARERRIRELEENVRRLAAEVEALRKEPRPAPGGEEEIPGMEEALRRLEEAPAPAARSRFSFGGYGEMHVNLGEGRAPDQFDIHRLVAYVGYDFADWLRFHSETELEHAFVSSGSDGELSLEQAYLDFHLSDPAGIRFGRVLVPVGIINLKHEPPAFNGVERPLLETVVIPTTWSADGIGLFGSLGPAFRYQAYAVGGLDGSAFTAGSGIRGGRIKERPGLHEPAFTGRLDWFPLAERPAPLGQTLRLGLSAYGGGLDNGNRGRNPGIDGRVRVLSADLEYTISLFDFRGVVAHEQIAGAREIGAGVASEILGWYVEAAAHVWPEAWKRGRLARSDLVAFARFEDVNTQFRMPSGIPRDGAGDRTLWTIGLGFFPVPSLVVKGDYQLLDDRTGRNPAHLFNLGVGWQF